MTTTTDTALADKNATGWMTILKGITAVVAWLGASASAVGLILTACGYIVEHSYLASIGVPRSVYDARPIEYTVTGGNFLVSLAPLAALGLAQFLLHCWWYALVIAGAALLARLCNFRATTRLLLFAAVYGLWLLLIMFQLETRTFKWFFPSSGNSLIALFTFVNFLALLYFFAECLWFANEPTASSSYLQRKSFLSRAPFGLVLVSALLLMPYLRGTYALTRIHPGFQAVGEGAAYIEQLIRSTNAPPANLQPNPAWQLIEIGQKKMVLQNPADKSFLIVPAEKITAFKILTEKGSQ